MMAGTHLRFLEFTLNRKSLVAAIIAVAVSGTVLTGCKDASTGATPTQTTVKVSPSDALSWANKINPCMTVADSPSLKGDWAGQEDKSQHYNTSRTCVFRQDGNADVIVVVGGDAQMAKYQDDLTTYRLHYLAYACVLGAKNPAHADAFIGSKSGGPQLVNIGEATDKGFVIVVSSKGVHTYTFYEKILKTYAKYIDSNSIPDITEQ